MIRTVMLFRLKTQWNYIIKSIQDSFPIKEVDFNEGLSVFNYFCLLYVNIICEEWGMEIGQFSNLIETFLNFRDFREIEV